MYAEDDLLPISALQHLQFCERQCALIHLEGVWEENRLTAEGRVMHDRVHEVDSESRGDVRVARGLRVRSLRLGLAGQCDVVEFRRDLDHPDPEGAGKRSSKSGFANQKSWIPFPIEYKRGKPKLDRCDEVQLCAQAICLEEMLGVDVAEGALFYGKTRRRFSVVFSEELRRETAQLASRLHALIASRVTPRAEYEKKCDSCSLIGVCMPKSTGGPRSAARYLARASAGTREEAEGQG